MESLVYDKEKLRELEALREEAVGEEAARTRRDLAALQAALEDKEKELEELDNR